MEHGDRCPRSFFGSEWSLNFVILFFSSSMVAANSIYAITTTKNAFVIHSAPQRPRIDAAC